jgi:hypothetical protein
LIKWKCNDSSVDDITVIVIYFWKIYLFSIVWIQLG